MLRVWHYDEIDGEWNPVDLNVDRLAPAKDVYDAMLDKFDLQPEQRVDDHLEIWGTMNSTSFMTGRFGIDKLWAVVWGPLAPKVVNYWRDEVVKAQNDNVEADNPINSGYFSNEIEFLQSLWFVLTNR